MSERERIRERCLFTPPYCIVIPHNEHTCINIIIITSKLFLYTEPGHLATPGDSCDDDGGEAFLVMMNSFNSKYLHI